MKSLHHKAPRVSPSETLTPRPYRAPRIPKENLDPLPSQPDFSPFRPPSTSSKPLSAKNRSPLPPRPPSNPLKRKLAMDPAPDAAAPADSGVQVIVRMRPPRTDEEEDDRIVQRVSPNAISILDHTFTFDSVVDAPSTQHDIYLLMGLPLVENCLAGFNSSIFAYGQTGSGKTYTMWGPTSALQGDGAASNERGLTPRVFERLFFRINEEEAKHSDKQLKYQCRCSFLEIYNEQITDLLDPVQRNLQIREDVRTGVYVDFLTEENVGSLKDVIQLLIKGLANRRTGATSINTESSRSHCVFTCVVESRSKSTADGLSSLRTSRINLVDLAGSERQKLTGAAGDRLKEAGNINRSLSQLGNLINILAEVSQSGKQRHIPYRDSKLTFLLQESLGGNAKLAMICAISPLQSCKSETFSTLRFAQRAKAIKNKAVVNEVTQDDVNILREQIRQLKDELLRMKSNGTPNENNGSYSTAWNARRSLSLLRMSLNGPRGLPAAVKDDSDEEMEIDEDDVERPRIEDGVRQSSCGEKLLVQSGNLEEASSCFSDNEMVYGETHSVHVSASRCSQEKALAVIDGSEGSQFKETETVKVCATSITKEHDCAEFTGDRSLDDSPIVHMSDAMALQDDGLLTENKSLEEKVYAVEESVVHRDSVDTSFGIASHKSSSLLISGSVIPSSSLTIVPCQSSPEPQSPVLSVSPVLGSYSRKSLRTSSSTSASQKNLEDLKGGSGSLKSNALSASLTHASRNSLAPAERLAASLHQGLRVIESQHSSPLRRSSFRFPVRPIDLKSLLAVSKIDVGTQTLIEESEMPTDMSAFICSYCKNKASEHEDNCDDMDLQLVPISGPQSSDEVKKLSKAMEKVLAGAIRREMALDEHCAKQAAEITQLNRLVQQYKHERECNAIIEQTREDKISRLESLMDGILPTEEFMEDEFVSLMNEHKLLKEKYENHTEVLRVNIELKRVQAELDGYRNFFDMGERDVLMEEIQDLRSKLQYYMDSSSLSTQKLGSLLKLTRSGEPASTPLTRISESTEESADQSSEPMLAPSSNVPEMTEQSAYEKFEQERRDWTETESKWICLSDELRAELEDSRSLAEKLKRELDCEKKCAEELKEALQTAMEGHTRILEQYADLEEKHIALLARHRMISNGIEDVKKAAAKAGVKGTESKFINSIAAEISALRVEREKERQYWRSENKGLQSQLRDTAEAVQAAGELLVRLKESEEIAVTAQKRACLAEQETEKAYQEIDNLKKNYDRQIIALNQLFVESRLPKEALQPASDVAKYDGESSPSDKKWKDEFQPFSQGGENGEFSKGTEPYAWYSGYDRCNI